MTVEERLERIERITAGFADERRKNREEYRQLADQRLGDRIEALLSGMGKFFQGRQGPL